MKLEKFELIRIDSRENLLIQLESQKLLTSSDVIKRSKIYRENYNIHVFIKTLINNDHHSIEYPLSLSPGERPDFSLILGGKKIGIEIVDAVVDGEVYRDLLIQDLVETGKLAKEKMLWGKTKENVSTKQDGSREKGRKLRERNENIILENESGDGWYRDDLEKEWAQKIEICISRKNELLDKEGFKKHNENWLLLYDQLRLIGVDYKMAVFFLFRNISNKLKFNRIFIISSNHKQVYEINFSCWNIME